jgi:hypothetical protein
VSDGEVSQNLRDRFLKYSTNDTTSMNGEQVIRLYRAVPSAWEDAPTAPMFSFRPNERTDKDHKLAAISRLKQYLGLMKEGRSNEEEILKLFLGEHIIDSIRSPFVPASNSRQYVEGIYSGEGTKIIEMLVPLKYTFPLTRAKNDWRWGQSVDSFKDEQEVCIVGRVEPEWVVSVNELH